MEYLTYCELLNKVASQRQPDKIKFNDRTYTWQKCDYFDSNDKLLSENVSLMFNMDSMTDEDAFGVIE